MSEVQAELIKQCFPSDRETWRKQHPLESDQPQMTRQEHIDDALVGLGDYGQMPVRKRTYNGLYGELIGKPCGEYGSFAEMGFTVYPTWDELIVHLKPWLANDEEFAKWQSLEPFDRFRLMVCGLPWNDEVIELLKKDDGNAQT